MKNKLTMYGVGDIALYRDDLDSAFAHVADTFRNADLAFCQLESVLSDAGDLSSCTRMGCSSYPALAGAIKRAGFDVVSFASNHALDYGRTAFYDTLDNLQNAGLYLTGAGRNE